MSADRPPKAGRAPLRPLELLIVVAVGAVLLAGLIPAVRKVRSVADRMRCAGNMRQIVIGFHHYHNDYNKLPPGAWNQFPVTGPFTFNCQGIGPLAACLQYLGNCERESIPFQPMPYPEAVALFNRLRTTKGINPPNAAGQVGFDWGLSSRSEHWTTSYDDFNLACAQIKQYQCPADLPIEPVRVGVFTIMGTSGLTFTGGHYPTPLANELGRTSYVPLCGSFQTTDPYFGTWEGMMLNRGDISLGSLTALDGTSNTIYLGETLGGLASGAPLGTNQRDFAVAWMAGVAFPTAWGIYPAEQARWYAMSSRHPGGVNAGFGDASVRFLRAHPKTMVFFTQEWFTLMEISGRQDAGVRDVSALLE